MFKFITFFLISASLVIAQDSLIFIIRVDDIQSRNTMILPRSIIPFENAVESRGGKVSWAVIPHRLIETQNNDGLLKQELIQSLAEGHEIVIHGYNHICPICGSSGHEMFCPANNINIPYSQQRDSIMAGLKILSDSLDLIPECFVPPGHFQDSVTFQVLIDLGINRLSSTGINKNFIYKNLFNLNPNNDYTWQITHPQYQQKLAAALNDIRNTGWQNKYYCLLLHDPFIREGYSNGIVIQWMGELLDSLNAEYGLSIRYKTLSEASEIFRQQIISAADNDIRTPENIFLFQNYPNPFNPSTVIRYNLPSDEFVTLAIFNSLGEKVSTLVNCVQNAGSYEINFDASDLAAGIYIYKIQAGSFTSSRKMMLIK